MNSVLGEKEGGRRAVTSAIRAAAPGEYCFARDLPRNAPQFDGATCHSVMYSFLPMKSRPVASLVISAILLAVVTGMPAGARIALVTARRSPSFSPSTEFMANHNNSYTEA